jgi:cell division initiation protein
MRYTPVELRHVRMQRSLFRGYKRAEADALLADVADSFEDVWRERGELADRVEEIEKRLDEFKQREGLLASTLVAAEKTAAEAVESAKREAEVILAEAHQEARSITRTAQNERERLFAESRRVETLLRAALGMVEETRTPASASGEGAEGDEAPSVWPNRENTREFEAISLEDLADEEPDEEELEPEDEDDVDFEPEDEAEHSPLPPVQEDVPPGHGRDFAWG